MAWSSWAAPGRSGSTSRGKPQYETCLARAHGWRVALRGPMSDTLQRLSARLRNGHMAGCVGHSVD